MEGISWEKVKLTPYEQEIEDNIEKSEPVEGEKELIELLVSAAKNTFMRRLVVEFDSLETKKQAINLLKERFEGKITVIT